MILNCDAFAQDFRKHGFLLIDGFFNATKVSEMESELQKYIRGMAPAEIDGRVVYESGPGQRIRNVFHLHHDSEYFNNLGRTPELWQLVQTIFSDEPILMTVELFGKPALVGSEVPYHQDNAYFNLLPDEALTVWIALADSNEQNGCVRYIEGSHQLGNLPHRSSGVKGNSMALSELPLDAGPEVCGIVKRGGVIIHHCNTIHRSEPNQSEHDRPGLLVVYKAARCRSDEVRAANYRKTAAQTWQAQGKA